MPVSLSAVTDRKLSKNIEIEMALVEFDQSVLFTVGVRKNSWNQPLANADYYQRWTFSSSISCTQSFISKHHRDGLTLNYRQPNLRQARNMRLTMTYAWYSYLSWTEPCWNKRTSFSKSLGSYKARHFKFWVKYPSLDSEHTPQSSQADGRPHRTRAIMHPIVECELNILRSESIGSWIPRCS